MYRCLSALTIVLAGTVATAQQGDRLESADCLRALAALQAREEVAAAAPPAGSQPEGRPRGVDDPQREALRRRAAQVCLGGDAGPRPPSSRFAMPPIVVPRIVIESPAPPRPVAPAATGAPPTQARPSVFVTACDPFGCWASDGSRLLRVGSDLLGPTGLCSVQGTLLHCP